MAQDLSAADRASPPVEQEPVNMAVGGLLVFEGAPAWPTSSSPLF